MSNAAPFDSTVDLPEATTWLLEASAGTGKTYQIAGLFVRLVAEYGVPVDKILAITFTTAATAELRDRIRARLRDAHEVLTGARPPGDDAVFSHLSRLADREMRVTRLEIALRAFDLAPISTIHGFAQRMLSEFAFDSKQDARLELLEDASELREELVDDALATVFASASPEVLAVLERYGFSRDALVRVAREMTAAIAPSVSPVVSGSLDEQCATAKAWSTRVREFSEWWASPERDAAWEEMVADRERELIARTPAKNFAVSRREIGAWLASGAPPRALDVPAFVRMTRDARRAEWRGAPEQLTTRPYWEVCERLDAFFAGARALPLAPLAVFAREVRTRFERVLLSHGALTFDAMLSRLAERIVADGGEASALAGRIRERFAAVFVDEFQDTDSSQWDILRASFLGTTRMFLIGDPKQAIYGFRGADVHVYLRAKAAVPQAFHRTMIDNHRSDPAAIAASNALFREKSGAFDLTGIDYVHVRAAKAERLSSKQPGLVLRWVDQRAKGGPEGAPITKQPRGLLASLAAREALAWLQGERAQFLRRGPDGESVAVRPEPHHVAVLVDAHHQGDATRRALARLGIPAVGASRTSVSDTPVAAWLAAWLDAVGGAVSDRLARTAAVTPLFGWSAHELAWSLDVASRGDAAAREAAERGVDLSERVFSAWTARLQQAAERWTTQGFFRTFDREATDLGVLPRVLALPDGERHATDLRHLVELLHVEERTHAHGPDALATWLRTRAAASGGDLEQRLESDARAVRVETVHASKGLQYPVVLLPFATVSRKSSKAADAVLVRGGDGAALHVHPKGSEGAKLAAEAAKAEERREGLRRAYVALTRAEHQTVAWIGPFGKGASMADSAMGRLSMRSPEVDGYHDASMPTFAAAAGAAPWSAAKERLEALAKQAGDCLKWAPEGALAPLVRYVPRIAAQRVLDVSPWPESRPSLHGSWRVTSYSSLAGSHRDRDEKATEEPPRVDSAPDADDPAAIVVPAPTLATFADAPRLSEPGGTEYGTWVHKVLELVDFTTGEPRAPQREQGLLEQAALRVGYRPTKAARDELAARLPALLSTPLDSEAHDPRGLPLGFSLSSVAPRDRSDELRFDLSLGLGTRWTRPARNSPHALAQRPGCVDPAAVHDALEAARDPSLPGLDAWLEAMQRRRKGGDPLVRSMAGILTGSIDLVFRFGAGADARYCVVDYKTNRIGACRPGHYARGWMDATMARSGYYLQSMLYTVALHRLLATRVEGYDYDVHVGGFLYLFLRGMSGPDTPRDAGRALGVFAHRWPGAVIVGLSQALGEGEASS